LSKDHDAIEVSVVMPCLNEAQTLKICIDKAKDCFALNNLKGEIIIVDNGSTDDSKKIASQCGARVVDQPVRGYGAALRKGFAEASGQFIVMGDADDSYDFSSVHKFVSKLKEGYSVVMGTRFKGEIKPGAMPWHHRFFGNPVLTFIVNFLYKAGISDAHCGMRGFRRDAIARMDLRTPGMELASEIIIKSARAGLKMTEIPIVLSPDGRDRRPHLRSFRDGWRHLRLMLMLAPNTLFVLPGFLICIISLFLQVTILWNGQLILGPVKLAENTMVLSMITSIIGLQMFYLGLFSNLFISPINSLGKNKQSKIIVKYSKFEKGATIGIILALVGFIGDILVVKRWYNVDFGMLDLQSIRHSIFFSTLLILGLQTILYSFFLNMVGVDRAIYVGDLNSSATSSKN